MQVNLETLSLRPNNRRCPHWIQPRPLDTPETVGDGNPRCGAFFPINPWVATYGAGRLAPGGRAKLAMPISQAFKDFVQRFRILMVDEFRTTVVHARDGSVMKHVWSRHKRATARGLTRCGSTNGKFVNRDLYASLNIWRCLALSVQPAESCRAAVQGRL